MDYYDKIATGYDELHLKEQSRKLDLIKKNIDIDSKTKILDVGCGTGISSKFDCFVAGIDPSIRLLKLNNNKNKILGIAEFLPFKREFFDYVISVTAVHNFDDFNKALEQMKIVGKENFVFSILKKSKNFDAIKKTIEEMFNIVKAVAEEKDVIFFCKKPQDL